MNRDVEPRPSSETPGQPRGGRQFDVLVTPIHNEESALEHKVAGFYVWADEGMLKVLTAVEGIWCVGMASTTLYTAMLDQRYDPDVVKDELETAVQVELGRRIVEAERQRLEAELNGTG